MTISKYTHTHRGRHIADSDTRKCCKHLLSYHEQGEGQETTHRFKRLLLTKQIKERVSKLCRRMDCNRAHVRQVLCAMWDFSTSQPLLINREVRNLEESWWIELSTTVSPPQLEDSWARSQILGEITHRSRDQSNQNNSVFSTLRSV